jgi:hypothetical protein
MAVVRMGKARIGRRQDIQVQNTSKRRDVLHIGYADDRYGV